MNWKLMRSVAEKTAQMDFFPKFFNIKRSVMWLDNANTRDQLILYGFEECELMGTLQRPELLRMTFRK